VDEQVVVQVITVPVVAHPGQLRVRHNTSLRAGNKAATRNV
jgi:hypothetical protein